MMVFLKKSISAFYSQFDKLLPAFGRPLKVYFTTVDTNVMSLCVPMGVKISFPILTITKIYQA